ncbi:HIT domain-containing protein [Salinibacillus xinjiangensis]|uniref:HIT domain-containing protein n=2 Tax=Salinibacillus xinjiangensis TaxID=1229268 RepID=A0A6G1X7I9_9BACI|nr:HIT domain-containing protein [Salinibacillus xinjiangensis]
MSMSDCIFCKILDGELPSAKVYEDEDVYAFLDISQVSKGHTLVIPKNHTENIYETDEETAQKVFARIPKIANALQKTYEPKGMNILQNNGEFAGQTVFHLHIHLIPRYDNNEDGFDLKWVTHNDAYDLQELSNEIRKNI